MIHVNYTYMCVVLLWNEYALHVHNLYGFFFILSTTFIATSLPSFHRFSEQQHGRLTILPCAFPLCMLTGMTLIFCNFRFSYIFIQMSWVDFPLQALRKHRQGNIESIPQQKCPKQQYPLFLLSDALSKQHQRVKREAVIGTRNPSVSVLITGSHKPHTTTRKSILMNSSHTHE